jgi:uncharacterized protein YoxC
MSNNSDLNPVVYDTENEPVGEQIFRPNVDNLNTDTAESRILTPVSDVNYHSLDTRNNKRVDPTTQTREAESLRSIIERLDNNEDGENNDNRVDNHIDNHTVDTQESDIRSIITEEYNKVLSTMRVDMVSIIKLLQTLHPKVNEQTEEIDNIKDDIYNLVQAVSNLRDKIGEANTLTIRRQQKYSGKVEDQISKICSRLEALERANFTTNEPVNREGKKRAVKDQARESQSRSTAKKSGSPQSTQEIYDAQGDLRRQNIRVRPKRPKATKDLVGNAMGPTSYNSSSRMANRLGKFEDTVDRATIKANKIASRGLHDAIAAKTTRKPRNDVINNGKGKSKSRDEDSFDESVESADRSDQSDQSEDLDTESEENGNNIQVFKS